MDGSSGPKTAPAGAGKAAAKAPAAKASATSTAPAATTSTESNDPFHVEKKQPRKIIPLKRKPTAQTTYRVVCPMCDTAGFWTPAAAGKEVKCPNPECLVPIFTAPEEEKVEVAPPKKPIFTPTLIFSIVAVMALLGAGIFFFMQQNKTQNGGNELPPLVNNPPVTNQQTANQTTEENKEPENTPPPFDPAAFRKQLLEATVEAALQRSDNRSKPFCRQLTAETYAAAGDLAGAQKQLEAFDRLNFGLNYFKITPLVRIAWIHLENKDREAASKLADEAFKYAESLPKAGSDAVRHAIALGCLLVALERYEDARLLLENREDVQDVTQSAARLGLIIETHSYSISASENWLPQLPLESPLSFATVYAATTRGYRNQSIKLIQSMSNEQRAGESLTGLVAADVVRTGKLPGTLEALIPGELSSLPAAYQTLAKAFALQALPPAKDSAALAEQLSATLPADAPAAGMIPDFPEIYSHKFDFPHAKAKTELLTRLLLTRFLSQAGSTEAAWQQVQKSLQLASSFGPESIAVDTFIKSIEQNRSTIESRLQTDYKLEGGLATRNAFFTYRNNAMSLTEFSERRLNTEKTILDLAIQWNLGVPLAKAVLAGELATPQSNLNTLIQDHFATELLYALKTAQLSEETETLQKKYPEAGSTHSALQLREEVQRLLAAGSMTEARDQLKAFTDSSVLPVSELQLADQLIERTPLQILEWIISIDSPVEQETALRLAGARLALKGKAAEFWKACQSRNLSPTDQCSAILGLIEGLPETPAPPEK
ncbi:MAG: hypothetical protein KDA78_06325 [Planctomycetaceae bacterium]|nr:hypothetical protein [Planctomycetaceae bacterium]